MQTNAITLNGFGAVTVQPYALGQSMRRAT